MSENKRRQSTFTHEWYEYGRAHAEREHKKSKAVEMSANMCQDNK